SYSVLALYRSQHDQQSWVGALTVILDTCALILTGIENIPDEAARFTFAMARHAVVDLAQVLDASPTTGENRLLSTEFAQLQDMLAASSIRLNEGTASEQKLAELREAYEPFVSALADRILVPLPPWIPPGDSLDDWQTTAWDDLLPATRQTLNKVMHSE
ncbi:MAG: two pore domain potassium channel family protein, partial [Ktedonobacteraceae bacterium]